MVLDASIAGFLVRSVHVVSAALLLGGACLIWGLAVRPGAAPEERDRLLILAAERYEWLFWPVVGLLIATGVGNFGAFGSALPGKDTPWGWKMELKLFAVVMFLLLSILRTLLAIRFGMADSETISIPCSKILQPLYAGTALYLVAVLLLAVGLAHT